MLCYGRFTNSFMHVCWRMLENIYSDHSIDKCLFKIMLMVRSMYVYFK